MEVKAPPKRTYKCSSAVCGLEWSIDCPWQQLLPGFQVLAATDPNGFLPCSVLRALISYDTFPSPNCTNLIVYRGKWITVLLQLAIQEIPLHIYLYPPCRENARRVSEKLQKDKSPTHIYVAAFLLVCSERMPRVTSSFAGFPLRSQETFANLAPILTIRYSHNC